MINESDFWDMEKDATLLGKNNNFLKPLQNSAIVDRAKDLLALLEERSADSLAIDKASGCSDEAASRIFKLDAERTFKGVKHRKALISVLQTVWQELQDYHQGVGFIAAFFLLFLPEEDVIKLIIGLHRHYVQGYFKSAPTAYVRDARVLGKILLKKNPKVGNHIQSLVAPEAFASKWFIGMNVHVLTFDSLMRFFEALIEKGLPFLFQYGCAFVKNREIDLLSADVSKALAILRLDKTMYPNTAKAVGCTKEGSLFNKIIDDSLEYSIDDIDIEALRHEVTEEMKIEDEKRKKREEMQNLSDDEITFSDED